MLSSEMFGGMLMGGYWNVDDDDDDDDDNDKKNKYINKLIKDEKPQC